MASTHIEDLVYSVRLQEQRTKADGEAKVEQPYPQRAGGEHYISNLKTRLITALKGEFLNGFYACEFQIQMTIASCYTVTTDAKALPTISSLRKPAAKRLRLAQ